MSLQDPSIEIRLATHSDLVDILRMLSHDRFASVPKGTGPVEDYVTAFDVIAAHADNELIVATLDGEVVATLQLTFIPGLTTGGGWRAQVEGVRVREDLRNLRIGTKLMEWVIARARGRGCRLVQLTTNARRDAARRFYERLGFIPSHVGMKLHL